MTHTIPAEQEHTKSFNEIPALTIANDTALIAHSKTIQMKMYQHQIKIHS